MKITMKYTKPPGEWLRFKLLMVASADKNTLFTSWRKKTLFSFWSECKMVQPLWKTDF